MCCQCDLRWLAGKAWESICANLVSELPIERWPRVNTTGSLESEERGDNGWEFNIDSISIANVLNFSYVNDSRERISTTRFQWCSTNNLTTIFYVLPKWGDESCHEAARDFIDDEESPNLIALAESPMKFRLSRRKGVTTYPTTILLSAVIRTNEELATHLLSFVNAHTMNWGSKAKATQSILVAPDRSLIRYLTTDSYSKTTRIFVIELKGLQSMWRDR